MLKTEILIKELLRRKEGSKMHILILSLQKRANKEEIG